jgi:hypothetical protein
MDPIQTHTNVQIAMATHHPTVKIRNLPLPAIAVPIETTQSINAL